jgi:DNA-binding IclR family transcriptional regulator
MTKKEPEVSLTVVRAINILNYLNAEIGPQSLSEISKSLSVSTTIAYRLLTTLKLEGMVIQDPKTKLYTLGTIFLDYANKVLNEMPIAPIVEPWLMKLRELTNETVGFYVPKGNVRICAIEFESQQEIRRIVGVGKRIPLHLGASGRAIMAFMSLEQQENILSRLAEPDRGKTMQLLEETRQRGYATNESELTPDVGALSVPVLNQHKQVIGALSISGPINRWNHQTMTQYVPNLLESAKRIEESI